MVYAVKSGGQVEAKRENKLQGQWLDVERERDRDRQTERRWGQGMSVSLDSL